MATSAGASPAGSKWKAAEDKVVHSVENVFQAEVTHHKRAVEATETVAANPSWSVATVHAASRNHVADVEAHKAAETAVAVSRLKHGEITEVAAEEALPPYMTKNEHGTPIYIWDESSSSSDEETGCCGCGGKKKKKKKKAAIPNLTTKQSPANRERESRMGRAATPKPPPVAAVPVAAPRSFAPAAVEAPAEAVRAEDVTVDVSKADEATAARAAPIVGDRSLPAGMFAAAAAAAGDDAASSPERPGARAAKHEAAAAFLRLEDDVHKKMEEQEGTASDLEGAAAGDDDGEEVDAPEAMTGEGGAAPEVGSPALGKAHALEPAAGGTTTALDAEAGAPDATAAAVAATAAAAAAAAAKPAVGSRAAKHEAMSVFLKVEETVHVKQRARELDSVAAQERRDRKLAALFDAKGRLGSVKNSSADAETARGVVEANLKKAKACSADEVASLDNARGPARRAEAKELAALVASGEAACKEAHTLAASAAADVAADVPGAASKSQRARDKAKEASAAAMGAEAAAGRAADAERAFQQQRAALLAASGRERAGAVEAVQTAARQADSSAAAAREAAARIVSLVATVKEHDGDELAVERDPEVKGAVREADGLLETVHKLEEAALASAMMSAAAASRAKSSAEESSKKDEAARKAPGGREVSVDTAPVSKLRAAAGGAHAAAEAADADATAAATRQDQLWAVEDSLNKIRKEARNAERSRKEGQAAASAAARAATGASAAATKSPGGVAARDWRAVAERVLKDADFSCQRAADAQAAHEECIRLREGAAMKIAAAHQLTDTTDCLRKSKKDMVLAAGAAVAAGAAAADALAARAAVARREAQSAAASAKAAKSAAGTGAAKTRGVAAARATAEAATAAGKAEEAGNAARQAADVMAHARALRGSGEILASSSPAGKSGKLVKDAQAAVEKAEGEARAAEAAAESARKAAGEATRTNAGVTQREADEAPERARKKAWDAANATAADEIGKVVLLAEASKKEAQEAAMRAKVAGAGADSEKFGEAAVERARKAVAVARAAAGAALSHASRAVGIAEGAQGSKEVEEGAARASKCAEAAAAAAATAAAALSSAEAKFAHAAAVKQRTPEEHSAVLAAEDARDRALTEAKAAESIQGDVVTGVASLEELVRDLGEGAEGDKEDTAAAEALEQVRSFSTLAAELAGECRQHAASAATAASEARTAVAFIVALPPREEAAAPSPSPSPRNSTDSTPPRAKAGSRAAKHEAMAAFLKVGDDVHNKTPEGASAASPAPSDTSFHTPVGGGSSIAGSEGFRTPGSALGTPAQAWASEPLEAATAASSRAADAADRARVAARHATESAVKAAALGDHTNLKQTAEKQTAKAGGSRAAKHEAMAAFLKLEGDVHDKAALQGPRGADLFALLEEHIQKGRTRLLEVFRECDKNRSGGLDSGELKRLLDMLVEDVSPHQLRHFYLMVDEDGDGNVSYKELVDAIREAKHAGVAVRAGEGVEVADVMRKLAMELDRRGAGVAAAFKTFDKDGSGALDHTEVAKMARSLMPGISRAEVRYLVAHLDSIDTDGNGTVSLPELKAAVSKVTRGG